jgi:two-component system response regulator
VSRDDPEGRCAEVIDYLFRTEAFVGRRAVDPPAVVLVDLNLPKIDALEVLASIRANIKTRLLRTIILTLSDDERDRLNGSNVGENSWACGPIELNEFAVAVRQLGLYWVILNEHAPSD